MATEELNGAIEDAERIAEARADLVDGASRAWESEDGDHGIEDLRETVEHLIAACALDSPLLALDQLIRLGDRWDPRGTSHVDAAVNALIEFADEALDSAAAHRLRTLVENARHDTPPADRVAEPLSPEAQAYVEAVRQGRARHALDLVRGRLIADPDLGSLYFDLLEPAQLEIGRLWQLGEIGVAEEHFATAVTQRAMTIAYEDLFGTAERRGQVLAACVEGERHEIGLRMVTDILELQGWDTHYLGADVPLSELLRTAEELTPTAIALTVMTTPALLGARRTIHALRDVGNFRILVGGYPFLVDPALVQALGADATGSNAREAARALSGADDLI